MQPCVFYPLSIIYYILPYGRAFNVFLVFHILLAGVFTYILCRRWTFAAPAAMMSSVIFMFGGFMISAMNLATTLSSIVWLPLVLYFFDKALEGGKTIHMLAASLSMGTMFLGGEPSVFYFTAWMLFIYSAFFVSGPGRKYFKRSAAIFAVVIAIASLLVLFQALPFAELLRHSDRGSVLRGFESVTTWSFPIKDCVGFFVPFFGFRTADRGNYLDIQNWATSVYAGGLSVLLLLIALIFRRGWRLRFVFFTGVLFLLMAMGRDSPLYVFMYKHFPAIGFIRYPVRFLFVTVFSIALASGAGIDWFVRARPEEMARASLFFRIVIAAVFFASIFCLFMYIDNAGVVGLAAWKDGGGLMGRFAASVMGNFLRIKHFLALFMGGGLLLYLGFRGKIRRPFASFALVSLAVFDLFSMGPYMPSFLSLDRRVFYEETPNISHIKKDKSLFRILASPKTVDSSAFLEGGSYEEGIANTKSKLTSNWPILYGIYNADGYESIRLMTLGKFMTLAMSTPPGTARFLDMMNVKYVAMPDKLDPKGYKLVRHDVVYLYENLNVLPRAFLVGSYAVLDREADISTRLRSVGFDPAKEVVLEEEPLLVHSPQPIVHSKKSDGLEIVKYSPNEVIIKTVVAEKPKFLFLSDTYYPGWKVFVDGRRDRIYKANFAFRAVYLAPGEHEVRFIFDPFTFKFGAAISIATLAAIAAYLVFMRRKKGPALLTNLR